MRRTWIAVSALSLSLLALAGCGGEDPAPKSEAPAATAPATTTAPAPAPAPKALSVEELMAKAGCDGKKIGTQLYSKETGRCMLDGAEITVAVFADNASRDQWVAAAEPFGMKGVTGDLWAAGATDQAAADAFKAAVG